MEEKIERLIKLTLEEELYPYEASEKISEIFNKLIKKDIYSKFKLLSDDERYEIMIKFCLGCGGEKPCYCQRND